MKADVALMLGMATDARNILRDPGAMMKVVPAMTLTAGTIHCCEGEGWFARKIGEMEGAGSGSSGTGNPRGDSFPR